MWIRHGWIVLCICIVRRNEVVWNNKWRLAYIVLLCRAACRCMRQLGRNQSALTLPLVPRLLSTHPYFETIEPDINDAACILATRAECSCTGMPLFFLNLKVWFDFFGSCLYHNGVLPCLSKSWGMLVFAAGTGMLMYIFYNIHCMSFQQFPIGCWGVVWVVIATQASELNVQET